MLRDAYHEQVAGLLAGGVDAVIVETCQDLLQAKAAIIGAQRAMAAAGRTVPLIAQVTVETTGTMLLGTEIGAALTALEPLGIDLIGLNCATGPGRDERAPALPVPATPRSAISVMPNAGLPRARPERRRATRSPRTSWPPRCRLRHRVRRRAGRRLLRHDPRAHPPGRRAVRDLQPAAARDPHAEPAVASLYQAVPFRQDASVLMIGERTNANGSKAFREAMLAGEFGDCVEIARSPDPRRLAPARRLRRLRRPRRRRATCARSPAGSPPRRRCRSCSTPPSRPCFEAGLELLGGRCVDQLGQLRGRRRAGLALRPGSCRWSREYGAAVVALTIDEQGQARTGRAQGRDRRAADRPTSPARGACAESDILVDCLTFTIATGQEETRRDGIETIEAIRELKRRHPDVQTTLGLSNISFGLNPAARQVLNSVFLHECVAGRPGLRDRARVQDPADVRRSPTSSARSRWTSSTTGGGRDARTLRPAAALPAAVRGRVGAVRRPRRGRRSWPRCRCSSGWNGASSTANATGLEADLDAALDERPALEIINDTLLAGMKTVGELFGSGQMQLPFVLQSAEVMKAAVAYLEPHMEKADGAGKGTIVLATVKGDVHDIGKNLVDIILSNNGYTVVNIGIKQPITAILDAADEHGADAIGMSGLLVKSTVVMKENLQEMNSRGVAERVPGAARRRRADPGLRRERPREICRRRRPLRPRRLRGPAADGRADGRQARRVAAGSTARTTPSCRRGDAASWPSARPAASARCASPPSGAPPRTPSRRPLPAPVPTSPPTSRPDPAVLGRPGGQGHRARRLRRPARRARHVHGPVGPARRPRRQGGPTLRGARRDRGPAAAALLAGPASRPRACWRRAVVYGYFPCVAEGDDLIVLGEPAGARSAPGSPSRASAATGGCAWPTSSAARGVRRDRRRRLPPSPRWASRSRDFAHELFEANAYRDYLEVHGLRCSSPRRWPSTGTAGSARSCCCPARGHRRRRPRDVEDFFKLGYRGARFSLGYGACPNLEDRAKIVGLLEPERIGVKLSEEFQLHPEQSTDAIVVHHPEAKYFNT